MRRWLENAYIEVAAIGSAFACGNELGGWYAAILSGIGASLLLMIMDRLDKLIALGIARP